VGYNILSLKIWVCLHLSVFICLAIVASQICKITQNSNKIRTSSSFMHLIDHGLISVSLNMAITAQTVHKGAVTRERGFS